MWYTQTHTYYSAIKKETMVLATTWMDHASIMLNEISQTGKDKHSVISLICGIKTNKQKNLSSQIQRTNWQLPEARSME